MNISAVVQEIVERKPILHIALDEGIINYTTCARSIKKEVERIIGKKVSDESNCHGSS